MTNRFDPVDFPDSFPNYEAFYNFFAERSVKNFSSGLGRGSGYLVIDWGRQSGVLQGTQVQRAPHKVGARILVTLQGPLRKGASVEAGRAGDSLDSPFTVTSLSPSEIFVERGPSDPEPTGHLSLQYSIGHPLTNLGHLGSSKHLRPSLVDPARFGAGDPLRLVLLNDGALKFSHSCCSMDPPAR